MWPFNRKNRSMLRQGVVEINGVKLPIRELTSADRQKFQEAVQDESTRPDSGALVVTLGCPKFAGKTPADVRAELPDLAIAKITTEVMRLSGLGADDDAKKKHGPRSDDSPSD